MQVFNKKTLKMNNSTIGHKEILIAKKKQKVSAKKVVNPTQKKIISANNKTRNVEEKLHKANHLYSFISHINRTISKVQNEEDLFNEACKIAVEKGNFKMAWLGTADLNSEKINIVSSAGFSRNKIFLLGNKTYDEDGPTELVLMGNTHHVINDLSKDTEISWSKFAFSKGLNSAITLAIKKNKKTVACFYIYSTELNFFDQDEIDMLLEVAHDISFCLDNIEKAEHHKAAENLILQSEKRFRLLTENSVDTQFNLITSNLPFQKSIKRAFGIEIKKGEHVLPARFPKQIIELYKNWYQRAFNGEFFTEIFYTSEPKDYWMEISFHPIKEGSFIVGTACHSRDISELKMSELSLKKSKAFTADVLNSLSSSIAVIDAKGNLIEVNDAWKQFSDRNEEPNLHKTGIGSNYLRVCRKSAKSGDSIAQKVLAELNSIYKNEKSDFYLEYPCHTTFSQNWYEMHATKLKSDESNLVISHVDISVRKNAELERSKVTLDLLQRNRDLEQFTFIVSHNLRAPLANILGISNVLSTEVLDGNESKEFMNGLYISANALDNVLKDLNTILQVKRDINDKKEYVNFSKLVDEISYSIANLIEKNHVSIVQNFSSTKKIFSIRAYIYSIFYNLIINSIKYRQPNLTPVIEIASEYKNDKTILTFKDNGLGIDLKSNSSKVFGLYNRFHRHVEGKGMGMFMTKSQVEALGGNISIEGEPLHGTTITIVM